MAGTTLSPLSTATTTALGLASLILVSPQSVIGYQPQNPPSQDGAVTAWPPTIVFHYEGEQTANLVSDITDHYVEDNTAIQDQIALKPIEITTHGFIGELNDVVPTSLQALQIAANKLTIISAYTPVLSTTALIAFNTAFQLYQTASSVANSAVAAWSSITNSGGESVITGDFNNPIIQEPNQTKQQQYFQQFFGYWNSRTLFTVQTPWAIFQNMAIKTLRSVQDAETRVITDFQITFKQMRFASTITVDANGISSSSSTVGLGRNALETQPLTSLGISTPPALSTLSTAGTQNYSSYTLNAYPSSFGSF